MRLALLALSLVACAPRAIEGSHVSGASVVTLVRLELGRDEDGVEPTAPRYRPHCNAFAVREPRGVRLVTAGHCVSYLPLRYRNPNGVGLGTATLERRDAARDLAWLVPADASGLVPLAVGAPPRVGSRVTSASSLFDATALGFVTLNVEGQYFSESMRIERGWSGSPVLDGAGRAWAVVVGCTPRRASALEGDIACSVGTYFRALEGGR